MNKVLIVTASLPLQNKLLSALPADQDVHIAKEFSTAVRLLKDFRPDILLLDGDLPQHTALHILSEVFPRLPGFVAMFLPHSDFYYQRQASRWGVELFFSAPYDWSLISKYLHAAESFTKAHMLHCAQLLRALHFNAGVQGYIFLMEALCLYRTDLSQQLENEIYPKVGEKFHVDYRAVEHSIRTAIQKAFALKDPKVWSIYFPVDEDGTIKCPSNKDFLKALVLHIL